LKKQLQGGKSNPGVPRLNPEVMWLNPELPWFNPEVLRLIPETFSTWATTIPPGSMGRIIDRKNTGIVKIKLSRSALDHCASSCPTAADVSAILASGGHTSPPKPQSSITVTKCRGPSLNENTHCDKNAEKKVSKKQDMKLVKACLLENRQVSKLSYVERK
jgi:hypothetical protein